MFCHITTLQQLTQSANGAGRLTAMIGASKIAYSDKEQYVRFRFPKSNGVNYCRITLETNDTYTMKLSRIHGNKETVVAELKGLYNDMLKQQFEEATCLFLSL
ncbi:hypothetical protein [Enterovibrio norvegicus]|uniref:hypothetical protein n=1 Tax=Enterovibrio norvegicus TaxID=188144 RepID=UPI00352EBCA8